MDYNNLYQQYSAFTDPFGFREEEDAVGNARPVTQTIKTDPITGEQTMTIKGSPQDLSAANPLTPTVVMPGQPSGAGGFLGGYEDMAPAGPARPQMAAPQMAAPMPAVDNRNIVPLEQPAQGGYDPEQMAQVLQQAGLNYQQPQPIATLAQAGTSDMNPPVIPQRPEPTGAGGFLGGTEDMAPAPAAPIAPVAPVAPGAPAAAPGAALTRQAESGGDYNVGYNRAGTSDAFGAYQILGSTYRDIQRRDPYFAGRDQRSLTPEEQDRANQVVRDMNTEGLRSQGVEPSESNLQLAHFLGAKGAADYLSRGYISPAAEAANGGPEKARQIAEARLALGRGPAVAGVGREMGMGEPGYGGAGTMPAVPSKTPWMDSVLNLQNNTEGLAAYVGNPDNPKEARDAASLILKSRYKEEDMTRQGQKMVTEAIQKGDWKTLERLMKPTPRQKREDEDGLTVGGLAKAFLLSAIGAQSAAEDVMTKMGVGAKWTSTTIGEDEVNAKFRKDGSAIEGEYITGPKAGQALDSDELRSISGGGSGGKTTKPDAGQIYEKRDANGNVVAKGRLITEYKNNKANTYIDLGGNKRAAFNSSWSPESISTASTKAIQGAQIRAKWAAPIAYNTASGKYAGEFNTANDASLAYQTVTPNEDPVLVDRNNNNQPVTVDARGNVNFVPNAKGAPGTAGGAGGQTTAGPTPKAASADLIYSSKLPAAPKYREAGFDNESPTAFKERTESWSKTFGKLYDSQQKNIKEARSLLPFVGKMKDLIDQGTGSGLGTIVDSVGNFFGYSTDGAKAIAAIAPLANKVLMSVERFEGPQSDKDVASYREAAGKLSDPKVPPDQKQAAFNTIIEILKRNAPTLDWDSVAGSAKTNAGTTSTGIKWERAK